jgi:hypothetical protein
MLALMRRSTFAVAKKATASQSIHSTASAANELQKRGDISELLSGNAVARNSVGKSFLLNRI